MRLDHYSPHDYPTFQNPEVAPRGQNGDSCIRQILSETSERISVCGAPWRGPTSLRYGQGDTVLYEPYIEFELGVKSQLVETLLTMH